MKHQIMPIAWNGTIVGSIANPKVDNFDLYGRWIPGDEALVADFLAALELGDQLEVVVGVHEPKIRGTVEIVPDRQIEIKMRP